MNGGDEGLAPTSGKRLGVGQSLGNGRRVLADHGDADRNGAGEGPAADLVHSRHEAPPLRQGELQVARRGSHEGSGTEAKTSWWPMSVDQRETGQITACTVPTTEETGT